MSNLSLERFVKIVIYIIVVIIAIFFIRFCQLQVIEGGKYRKLSLLNRVEIITLSAPRGIIYDRNGVVIAKNKPVYSASIMYLNTELDNKGLSELLDVEESVIKQKIVESINNPFRPVILKQGMSFEDMAKIEARRSDFPGLIIETNITRQYIYNKTGAHLLGYLGKPDEEKLKYPDYSDITPDTFIGKWGVEAMFDKKLKGVSGKRVIEIDALGRQLRTLEYIAPRSGESLNLSIDLEIQKVAEASFDKRSGALIAINPKNGEILSMLSLPSFNPNDFSRGIDSEKWVALNNDRRFPLINRVFQSSYPPGSVFKPIVAMAGIEEGVITRESKVYCRGLTFLGGRSFGCWKKRGHGYVSLQKGLIESCDIYFYEVGRRLGVDTIEKYARLFGLGKKTKLGIVKEVEGIVPSTDWKFKKLGEKWYLGETLNTAIGQGYLSITPVQAAVMITMIATNGKEVPITVIKRKEHYTTEIKPLVKSETFSEIKKALLGVVKDAHGTARSINTNLVEIAGKTGTAQVIRGRIKSEKLKEEVRDHAWFIAYAPYNDPEIALSVFVEHGGHGGSAAAPIAKKVIEAYIKGRGKQSD